MVVERKQKAILVGLSGGLDSMVAAYLLRIQKKELFAVLIASTPEDLQDSGDSMLACHQSDARIAAVKKFCEHLHIPLTVIRPREEFMEEVLDPWVASRLEVTRPRQCQNCHLMRMRILYQKAVELNCESFATGHYAKLVKHVDGKVSVHSSNDGELDQSGFLVGLSQEMLQKMELPLSELQHKEVLKIAENFELNLPLRTIKVGQCLSPSETVQRWLYSHSPMSLRQKGEIIEVPEVNRVGPHEGMADIEFGRAWKVEEKNNEKKEWVVVGANLYSHEVQVSDPKWFIDTGAQLTHCQWDEGTDFSIPMKGYLHFGGGLQDKEVTVYPKTLGGAMVELTEGQDTFIKGADLVVFKRRGKNAKVIVSGRIGLSSRHWRENVVIVETENGNSHKEINKDFNF